MESGVQLLSQGFSGVWVRMDELAESNGDYSPSFFEPVQQRPKSEPTRYGFLQIFVLFVVHQSEPTSWPKGNKDVFVLGITLLVR